MSTPEPPKHARIRRMKWILRYLPRRAVFHRYPIVGRFADAARRRAYLWSFKPEHMRPAFYAGAILAFWPVLGIQIPLALALAVVFRANIMVAGGLQLITNPVTAVPVYLATFRVGRFVMELLGWRRPDADSADVTAPPVLEHPVTIELSPEQMLPHELSWTATFGSTMTALFIGGTLCGLVLACVLDVIYRWGFAVEQRHLHKKHRTPVP